MKRKYTKPMMAVESFKLDHPIAANCNADYEDVKSLIDIGYFGESCKFYWQDSIGYDTVCYHSNVLTAFTS